MFRFVPRFSQPHMQTRERNFCFVYFGNRLHAPDFHELKFNLVEGCCDIDGERLIQYVKISLHANNTRREGSIPKIIEQYNRMEGRTEKITPVVFFPRFQASAIVCFKARTGVRDNPILNRIAQEQQREGGSFWRWVSSSKKGLQSHLPLEPEVQPGRRRRFITSVHDILRSMQLPESVVSVQRVYDELSEPYFRQFNVPLGEGTGCVPLEHRDFIVSEIKRLFEEELSYIQQPSASGALPMHARALVENAGWMGDILLSGEGMDTVAGGAIISAVRAENASATRRYAKTEQRTSDRLERRGVGHSLREFMVFYALQWNDAGCRSVCKSVEELHAGWTPPLETLTSFKGLVAGISLRPCVVLEEGSLLKVPCVEKLVKLLCDEGLLRQITTSSATGSDQNLQRMVVREDCKPVSCIQAYFKKMIQGDWAGKDVVEVSATDVVRELNGGDAGVYRRSCVSQFMRPFMFDGSVEGYFWKGCGGAHCEKYIVHVTRVAERCEM
jgi:hypothetical protein